MENGNKPLDEILISDESMLKESFGVVEGHDDQMRFYGQSLAKLKEDNNLSPRQYVIVFDDRNGYRPTMYIQELE